MNQIPTGPRAFRVLAILASSLWATGCVSATAYEEASSAAEVEREGHRRASLELASLRAQLARADAEREALAGESGELKRRAEANESTLAARELELAQTTKSQEKQAQLLSELQGELARVGANLNEYEGEKQRLSAELQQAEAELKEKSSRLALLEATVVRLRSEVAASSGDNRQASEQLESALAELAELEDEVAAEPSAEETEESDATKEQDQPTDPQAADDPTSTPPKSDDDTDAQDAEDESIYEPAVEEVFPDDES